MAKESMRKRRWREKHRESKGGGGGEEEGSDGRGLDDSLESRGKGRGGTPAGVG